VDNDVEKCNKNKLKELLFPLGKLSNRSKLKNFVDLVYKKQLHDNMINNFDILKKVKIIPKKIKINKHDIICLIYQTL
jgi:hypothetical protein